VARPRRLGLWVVLALVAILALGLLVTAPPGPQPLVANPFTIAAPALAHGAIHVHTARSDGSGTVDEVAAAAARAGLQFVVFTDHGDGTRPPLAPAYRSGVLCLDGVEISVDGGHYVALGLGPAPYRLAGAPADVIADVHRLGGFGFAAHPDSSKPALAWRDWTAPFDGLEWFNLDSEWRDDGAATLAMAALHYPLRPVAALGSLASRDQPLLRRWADLARTRRVVGIASVDAHARMGTEGDRAWMNLRLPGYEALLSTAQVSVELAAPLAGDAARDAAAILGALRDGRAFSTIAARAPAGRLAIEATRGDVKARMGQFLGGTGRVDLQVEGDAPRGWVIRIVCDGKTITQTLPSSTFHWSLDADEVGGSCQAIAGWAGATEQDFVTWAVTNPIYFRAADPVPTPIAPPVLARTSPLGAQGSWDVEHSPGSEASVTPSGAAGVTLAYALAPGDRASQYAAMATPDVGGIDGVQWMKVTLSADAPMRVSLQLRTPDGHRWQRSLVAGPEVTTQMVPVAAFAPVGGAPALVPDRVRGILVVVDTVNTPPGRRGTVTLHELRAEIGATRP
jgi:hypothetical protein